MEIVTGRLVLREFEKGDWPPVLRYQSHPDYLRYYPWTERTARDVRQFVQSLVDWRNEVPRTKYQLAITLKSDSTVIGNCGIRLTNEGTREAEFGCELSPEFWRRGFAFEAAQAIFKFAFGDLRLHRIWAQCIAENLAIRRLLEKRGILLCDPGTLRSVIRHKLSTTLESQASRVWICLRPQAIGMVINSAGSPWNKASDAGRLLEIELADAGQFHEGLKDRTRFNRVGSDDPSISQEVDP